MILSVQDNPANLSLVDEIVCLRHDAELVTATRGATGVAMAVERKPDLVILDINLTDFSGLEVLRRLRADPATAAIPAIALSANAEESAIVEALNAGFSRYLSKPLDVEEFIQVASTLQAREHVEA